LYLLLINFKCNFLGDRIAIISNGKLIAHGTGLFLKQKFGPGYYLTFSKKKTNDESKNNDLDLIIPNDEIVTINNNINTKEPIDTLLTQQDKELYQFIKDKFHNATLIENIGTEITFSVSNQPEFTKNYETYFKEIENNMMRLNIDGMGCSDSTLEEIFIKIAKEPEKNTFTNKEFTLFKINFTKIKNKLLDLVKRKNKRIEDSGIKLNEKQLNEYSKLTKLRVNGNFSLLLLQFYGLFLKRLHRFKRNFKGFFAEIILPVVFVSLALLVATLKPNRVYDIELPELELHPWYYSNINKIFLSKSSSSDYSITNYVNSTYQWEQIDSTKQPNIQIINKIYKTFFQNGSLGNKCMTGYKINDKQDCEDYIYKKVNNNLDNHQKWTLIKELNLVNYSYTKISPGCECTKYNPFQKCANSSGGDINMRQIYSLKTKDLIYDLTSRNISDWIIKTELQHDFYENRYGGFEFLKPYDSENHVLDNIFQMISSIANVSFQGTNPLVSNQNLKIWYNLVGFDTSVSYLNVINNAILRSKIKTNPAEHGIVAFNHPMKYTKNQFLNKLQNQSMTDLFVSICIIFALSFIPASFLVFLLEERENQSKQLQFVSGLKPYLYWTTNFLLDLVNYLVPCILCIIVFVIFDIKAYLSAENLPCLIALILLYGWSCIPLMYPLNYLFKLASTAFVASSCLNVFIGIVTVMTINVIKQLAIDDPSLMAIHDFLEPLFIVLFPHYCLAQGFIHLSYLYNVAEFKHEFGIKNYYDPFDFNNNGRNLFAMFMQGIVFFILNLLIQYNFFIHSFTSSHEQQNEKQDDKNKNENEDSDVAYERERVKKSNDHVKLINLTKIFNKRGNKWKKNKHIAVNNLTLGINKGECFGLIGINGAGKTTSFKMITGI